MEWKWNEIDKLKEDRKILLLVECNKKLREIRKKRKPTPYFFKHKANTLQVSKLFENKPLLYFFKANCNCQCPFHQKVFFHYLPKSIFWLKGTRFSLSETNSSLTWLWRWLCNNLVSKHDHFKISKKRRHGCHCISNML